MPLARKLLLIILDGLPWRNWPLMGNLEGWAAGGQARKWRMRSVLPSMSASCYASIHTGLSPQEHRVLSNNGRFRVHKPDVFSEVAKAGGRSGAVANSYWSEIFNRAPFDFVRDIEYDEPEGPIHHGRFHSMTGETAFNQTTPSDMDLFATLTMLTKRFGIDYGMLHTCTLDSMGHRFGHACVEMDKSLGLIDYMLASFLPMWLEDGYEVVVTADHGQNDRGYHGGQGEDMQDFALYYFGPADGPADGTVLDQLQMAPTILARLGVAVPDTMTARPFLS